MVRNAVEAAREENGLKVAVRVLSVLMNTMV
jgi:hypothetical protein